MFAGWVGLRGQSISHRETEFLKRAVTGGGNLASVQLRRNAVFVQSDGDEVRPDDALFVSDSRLDNAPEIAGRFGSEAGEIIRTLFESRGDRGIAELRGAFAFAHWDQRTSTLTLARDYFGRLALFYHIGPDFVAFASHLNALFALPSVPRELDERQLANFLALNHRGSEETIYRGVLRVPTRMVVRLTRDSANRRYYWSPNLNAPPPYERDEDYIARARELFDGSTARLLRNVSRAAITVSGGLDSSAVAATAARLGSRELDCYTCISSPDIDRPARRGWYLDERMKVEALSRLHPSLRMHYVSPRGTHTLQSDPASVFVVAALPRRNVANLAWGGTLDEAILCDGHRFVMGGARGNMTLSWDGRFSLATLLKQGRMLALLSDARAVARVSHRSLARVLAGEAILPLLPGGTQRMLARLRGNDPEDVSRFSLLRREVIEGLDLRRQWRDEGFDPTYRARGSSASFRAHQIFDQFQMARDISAQRGASGMEGGSPFADRDLIEFCLAVPERLYRRDGIKRWFARQVFADRLPPEILNETKSGEQASNWFESLDARKPQIAAEVESLEHSRLASRLIDLPRLRRLIAEWPRDAREAQARQDEYKYGVNRAVHVGQFIRWVEGGNA